MSRSLVRNAVLIRVPGPEHHQKVLGRARTAARGIRMRDYVNVGTPVVRTVLVSRGTIVPVVRADDDFVASVVETTSTAVVLGRRVMVPMPTVDVFFPAALASIPAVNVPGRRKIHLEPVPWGGVIRRVTRSDHRVRSVHRRHDQRGQDEASYRCSPPRPTPPVRFELALAGAREGRADHDGATKSDQE